MFINPIMDGSHRVVICFIGVNPQDFTGIS